MQGKTAKLTDEIICSVAGDAALEAFGVASLSSKGVRVFFEKSGAVIDLFLYVNYGARVPDAAWEVQEKVKAKVEELCGIGVYKVNVNIQGVE